MRQVLRAAITGAAIMAAITTAAGQEIPALGPLPEVRAPVDNPTTPAKIELGRKLFWDGRLSGNGAMACVACHLPELGWGTGSPISFGYPGTQHWRNSQTVLNSAYYSKLFWEGNEPSLEAQAEAAATGAVAGNGDPAMMEMRLRAVPEYVEAFREVFGTPWPNINDAWLAIAAFERTIVSDPERVPFDRYRRGEQNAMGDAAKRGKEIFAGKANCIACHNGPLASDQRLYNLGVPENPVFTEDPLYQITLRWENYQKGISEQVYRGADRDLGLYYVTKNPEDMGKFRTPSLRELVWTGPYMHNGVFETLDEVVTFYDAGGGEADNKPAFLRPLGLTDAEMQDLVEFLKALSMTEPLLIDEPRLPETMPFDWSTPQ